MPSWFFCLPHWKPDLCLSSAWAPLSWAKERLYWSDTETIPAIPCHLGNLLWSVPSLLNVILGTTTVEDSDLYLISLKTITKYPPIHLKETWIELGGKGTKLHGRQTHAGIRWQQYSGSVTALGQHFKGISAPYYPSAILCLLLHKWWWLQMHPFTSETCPI